MKRFIFALVISLSFILAGCGRDVELDKRADVFWKDYIRRSKLIDSLSNAKNFTEALRESLEQQKNIKNSPIDYWSKDYTDEYKKPCYWE